MPGFPKNSKLDWFYQLCCERTGIAIDIAIDASEQRRTPWTLFTNKKIVILGRNSPDEYDWLHELAHVLLAYESGVVTVAPIGVTFTHEKSEALYFLFFLVADLCVDWLLEQMGLLPEDHWQKVVSGYQRLLDDKNQSICPSFLKPFLSNHILVLQVLNSDAKATHLSACSAWLLALYQQAVHQENPLVDLCQTLIPHYLQNFPWMFVRYNEIVLAHDWSRKIRLSDNAESAIQPIPPAPIAQWAHQVGELIKKGAGFAILSWDIEGLTSVNHRYGRAFGDHLIAQVGSCLAAYFGVPWSRLADDSDEAMLAFPFSGIVGRQDIFIAAQLALRQVRLAERISAEFPIHVNIGIVFYPEDGDSLPELLRRLELRMFTFPYQGDA